MLLNMQPLFAEVELLADADAVEVGGDMPVESDRPMHRDESRHEIFCHETNCIIN